MKKNYFKQLKDLLSKARDDVSKVKVSAIIKTDKGLFKGVNYEDPVINLGICAERNAIFSGVTSGMTKIYEIHVLSNIDRTKKLQMCGACREIASHFSDKKTNVYVYSLDGKIKSYKLFDYLPYSNKKMNELIVSRKRV